jgi:hypothetical protein
MKCAFILCFGVCLGYVRNARERLYFPSESGPNATQLIMLVASDAGRPDGGYPSRVRPSVRSAGSLWMTFAFYSPILFACSTIPFHSVDW